MNYSFDSFCSGNYDWDSAEERHTSPWIIYDRSNKDTKTTKDDVDRVMQYSNTNVVKVSGLTQDSFEYFISTYGTQLKAIDFFKNKLVEDWSMLGSLPQLKYVKFFLNQRIDRFWDMSGNTSLIGICIEDFSRLKNVEMVNTAPALETFEIGNAIWNRAEIDSFTSLAGSPIKHLGFHGRNILDKDLTFLSSLPNLETYDFPTNLYTTEQVAWIAANFPHLSGFAIAPYTGYPSERHPEGGGWIVGKRKPYLEFQGNEDRIKRYEEAFEVLKRKYKDVPYYELFGLGQN